MSGFPESLEPVRDMRPANWVVAALNEWPQRPFRVRDLVPPVFDAYARILHHLWLPGDVRDSSGTWADRAKQVGHVLGPETGRKDLEVGGDAPWSIHEGSISESELGALIRVLDPEGAKPPAWLALWSGFGSLGPGSSYLLLAGGSMWQRLAAARIRLTERIAQRRAQMAARKVPTFSLLHGNRSYFLFRGDLDDAIRLHREFQFHPPTLWWPDDRSWFVHTEIDAMSTYLGGSRGLIDRLVGEQILESFEVQEDTLAAL
jgi:hypothetical protein